MKTSSPVVSQVVSCLLSGLVLSVVSGVIELTAMHPVIAAQDPDWEEEPRPPKGAAAAGRSADNAKSEAETGDKKSDKSKDEKSDGSTDVKLKDDNSDKGNSTETKSNDESSSKRKTGRAKEKKSSNAHGKSGKSKDAKSEGDNLNADPSETKPDKTNAETDDWDKSADAPTSGKVEAKVENKDGRTVLKLGVEHSSSLSPVDGGLQAGSIFNEDLLTQEQDKLSWYPIPAWLAGQWRRTLETTVFSHDYASGWSDNEHRSFMSEQIADFGVQADKLGNVWNCNLSSRGISDRGSYRSIALVMGKAPIQSTPNAVIFREVFTVVNVNKSTNVILDSYLVESITRHRRNPDGSLETEMSAKIYNSSGTPRQVQENVANDRRVSAFAKVDNYKGRDIKADFIQFLKKQGLAKLVPD